MTVLRLIVVCFALLVCSGCSVQSASAPDSNDTSFEAQPTSLLERGKPIFEAREWLQSNPNPYALAGNRFGTTQQALAFVEYLYENGAEVVYVDGIYDEEWRIEMEGGPYADVLIVQLPDDPQQRESLFEIAAKEAKREGFAPERDTGQEVLVLWWD